MCRPPPPDEASAVPPGPTGLRSRSASAASQAPSEGRESRSGSGTSTSNAYINKELLPAEFGRFYWLTYFGNYAVVYGVARCVEIKSSTRLQCARMRPF